MKPVNRFSYVLALSLLPAWVLSPQAFAAQEVAPPVAQVWLDGATFSGMGMPGMGGMGADPLSMMGGLLGGRGGSPATGGNNFGNTRTMSPGRWLDVTLRARINPALDAAQQRVPEGFMAPALDLRTPKNAPAAPSSDDDEVSHQPPEKPQGRMLMYWGCGDTVRPGQPRVLDMATAKIEDLW